MSWGWAEVPVVADRLDELVDAVSGDEEPEGISGPGSGREAFAPGTAIWPLYDPRASLRE